jgi:hypothetical protein
MNTKSIVMLVAAAALVGCGKKKEASTEKPVDNAPAAQPAAASAAPAAQAAAAPAAAKLGAFDLAATSIEPATLFAGATFELHKADGGGIDGYDVDTLEIQKDAKTVAEIEMVGGKATALRVYEQPALADIAKAHPAATCIQDKYGVRCDDGGFLWLLDENAGHKAEWGTEFPIAEVEGAGAKASWVQWEPAADKQPTVTMPANLAAATDEPAEDGDRKPTAAEIKLCARLRVVTAGCGYGHDYEFGWVKGKKEKIAMAAAEKSCDVEHLFTENGPEMPVPLYDEPKVAAMEAAAKASCAQLVSELEKYSMVNEQLP